MVMVMGAVRVDRLEARDAGPDVDALDEAVSRQLLERPVDARNADAAALAAEPVEDLLRREAAVLAAE
jgi:hypothetical protein